MYLCRLVLNQQHRMVRRDMGDCHELHRTVLSAFPERPDPGALEGARSQFGLLYRLEEAPRDGQTVLYVQSSAEPDWTHLPAGYLAEPVACKPLGEAYTRIQNGMVLRFRLRANPTRKILTKSAADGRRQNGKRVELRDDEELVNWLRRKAEAGGFDLLALDEAPTVPDVRIIPEPGSLGSGRHKSGQLTICAVIFEGRLRVTDADRFRETLATGIGSGKAYGMGMLSVAPVMPG